MAPPNRSQLADLREQEAVLVDDITDFEEFFWPHYEKLGLEKGTALLIHTLRQLFHHR